MPKILRHIAQNDNEMSYRARPHRVVQALGRHEMVRHHREPVDQLPRLACAPRSIECFGQVGGVYNMMFNRDDMIHFRR